MSILSELSLRQYYLIYKSCLVIQGGVLRQFCILYNKGLYITGELLDVDGDCGGYNLTNAWITGYLAGTGASND